jgi:hypothetical protein
MPLEFIQDFPFVETVALSTYLSLIHPHFTCNTCSTASRLRGANFALRLVNAMLPSRLHPSACKLMIASAVVQNHMFSASMESFSIALDLFPLQFVNNLSTHSSTLTISKLFSTSVRNAIQNLRFDTMQLLQRILNNNHPRAAVYQHAYEVCMAHGSVDDLSLSLHTDDSTLYRRRCNLPPADEVAVIIPRNGEQPDQSRDTIVRVRGGTL